MLTNETDRRFWLFGAILAALLISGIGFLESQRPQQNAEAEIAQAALPPPEPVLQTATIREGERARMSTRAARRAPITHVYECEQNGERVLSDQPCGANATIREISAPNRMDAQDTRNLYRPVYGRSHSFTSAGSGSGSDRDEAWCASIQNQIDRVNARMRRGYTSWEGERLRERLRELSRQRHEARCIR